MGFFQDKFAKVSEWGSAAGRIVTSLARDAKANPGHFANGANNAILSGAAMVAGAPVDAVNFLLKPIGLGSQRPALGSAHIESMLGKAHGAYIDLWGQEHKDGRLTAKTDSQERAAIAGEMTGLVAGIAVPGGYAAIALKAPKAAATLGNVAESSGVVRAAFGTVMEKPMTSAMTVVGVNELAGFVVGSPAQAEELPANRQTPPGPAPSLK